MKNVVMKFGGTSVADADAISRLIAIVSAQAARSARHRSSSSPPCRR